MGVTLNGLDALTEALQRKIDVDEKLRRTVKKHGAQMQSTSMRTVPVRTGTLKRSITLNIEDNGMTARMAPHTDYAQYVEYGTRHQTAKPYIRPAYDKQIVPFRKEVKKIVEE